MPLEQTTTGLVIQDLAEIKSVLDNRFREEFGADVPLGVDSVFGKVNGIMAEELALIQAKLQSMQAGFSRDTGQAAALDKVSALVGSERRGASQSTSTAGRCTGTDATIILNGSTVIQQNTALDTWTVVNGTDGISPFGYEIGADVSGEATGVEIEAVETGDKVFSSSSEFAIGSPISGWGTFDTSRDIETFEIGQDVEQDGQFRDRGRDELFAGGNDISGIKAVITKVQGVSEVQVFENTDCTTIDSRGILPGRVESIVTGGSDLDVATAILLRVPPGTSLQGTTLVVLADSEGNPRDMQFTRPALVEITVAIIINNLDAEGTLPENFEDVVSAAVLEFGNANTRVSQDVLWQQFIGPVAAAIQDSFTGKFAYKFIDSEISTGGATSSVNIPISIRERADFDSARITITLN